MTFIWIFYRIFLTIGQQGTCEREDYERNISIVMYFPFLLFFNNTPPCTPFAFSFFVPIILEAIQ